MPLNAATGEGLGVGSPTLSDMVRAKALPIAVALAVGLAATLPEQEIGPGTDLRRRNLRAVDLTDADLACAILANADLCFAELNSTKLPGADLRFAILTAADLPGADLREANLRGTNVCAAKLDASACSRHCVER